MGRRREQKQDCLWPDEVRGRMRQREKARQDVAIQVMLPGKRCCNTIPFGMQVQKGSPGTQPLRIVTLALGNAVKMYLERTLNQSVMPLTEGPVPQLLKAEGVGEQGTGVRVRGPEGWLRAWGAEGRG